MSIGDSRVIDPLEERDRHPTGLGGVDRDEEAQRRSRYFASLIEYVSPEACSYLLRDAYPLLAVNDNKIRVIKEIRSYSGHGLKNSKDFAELLMGDYGIGVARRCQKAIVAKAGLWAYGHPRDKMTPEANQAADFVLGLAEDLGISIVPDEEEKAAHEQPAQEKVTVWVVVRVGSSAETTVVAYPDGFLTANSANAKRDFLNTAWAEGHGPWAVMPVQV